MRPCAENGFCTVRLKTSQLLQSLEERLVVLRSPKLIPVRHPRRLTRRTNTCCAVRTRSSPSRTRSHPQHRSTTRTPTTSYKPVTDSTLCPATHRHRWSRSRVG